MKKEINLVEIKSGGVFVIDMMYAGTQNMMLTDVYTQVGLGNRCFIQPDLQKCLLHLEPVLKQKNLKLKICDAYRPPRAFDLMKKIIPQPGFFAAEAEKSQHCHASAVDVTLLDEQGRELPFPCKVDAFEEKYARLVAAGQWNEFQLHLKKAKYSWNSAEASIQTANRDMLRNMMENAGLEALEHEWWHYNLPNREKYPLIDCEFFPDGEVKFFTKQP